jgi:Ser-tRNA(Ala) deacylase AlaX
MFKRYSIQRFGFKITQIRDLNRRYSMEEKSLLTRKLYWKDTYLFEHHSAVIDLGHDEKKGYWVKLKETIFHPQGGGQPSDVGGINGVSISAVEESREPLPEGTEYDLAVMTHYLERDLGVKVGDTVKIEINKEVRLQNSARHTAGHIIAGLMRTQHGYKKQTAANHFPDQAKVEFMKDGDKLSTEALTNSVLTVIEEGRAVSQKFQEVPEIHKHPSRGNFSRCVTIEGLWAEPCSGTHTSSTKEIKDFTIRKIAEAKSKVTVGYNSHYGMFARAESVRTQKNQVQASRKNGDTFKKEFTTANGSQVLFLLSDDSLNAFVIKADGEKVQIDSKKIFINISDSPAKTTNLVKKSVEWQQLALERVQEVSLAFSGSVVITQLSDWSFDLEQEKSRSFGV